MPRALRMLLAAVLALYVLPVAVSAVLYFYKGRDVDWRSADSSSARLLPVAREIGGAAVYVLAARTVSWRGILATHSWIVIKEPGEAAYQRFDYTAWGRPIWKDRFAPDARWFGNAPEIIVAVEGVEAARMVPLIRAAISDYRYPRPGDYRIWPGPNSNTFVAAIMQEMRMKGSLPATAIGKDFPYDGRWVGWTPSHTGIRLNLGGYAGIALGWYEGLEVNLLGAVAGVDLRRPALKVPGLGRLGWPANGAALTAAAPSTPLAP